MTLGHVTGKRYMEYEGDNTMLVARARNEVDKTMFSSCRDSQLKMSPLTSLVLLAVQAVGALGQAPVPVVLWHGMGDSAAGMIGIAVSDRKPQLSRECH